MDSYGFDSVLKNHYSILNRMRGIMEAFYPDRLLIRSLI
jgi:hypothetical protein